MAPTSRPAAPDLDPERQVVLLWRRVTERIPPGEEGLDWCAAVTGVGRDDLDVARFTRDAIVHRSSPHPGRVQHALAVLRRVTGKLEAVAAPPGRQAAARRGRLARRVRGLVGWPLGVAGVVVYLIAGFAAIVLGIVASALPFAFMLSGALLVLDGLINLVPELLGLGGPGYVNPVILFDGSDGPAAYALQRGGVGLATFLVGLLLANLGRLLRAPTGAGRRLLRRAGVSRRRPRA